MTAPLSHVPLTHTLPAGAAGRAVARGVRRLRPGRGVGTKQEEVSRGRLLAAKTNERSSTDHLDTVFSIPEHKEVAGGENRLGGCLSLAAKIGLSLRRKPCQWLPTRPLTKAS